MGVETDRHRIGRCVCCGAEGRIYARGLIARCYARARAKGNLGAFPPVARRGSRPAPEAVPDARTGAVAINQFALVREGPGPRLERMFRRAFSEPGCYVPGVLP